jgi:hypothetical protein
MKKRRPQRMPRGSWLLLPVLFLTVCNWLLWSQHTVSISPDGLFRLTVWTKWGFPDSSVRVALSEKKWPERTILSDPATDRWPALTEVYWDMQSRRVGVLICDSLASNILFAYDLDQRRVISSEVVIAGIRQSLVSRYHLIGSRIKAYDNDPIACVCDNQSGNFRRFENIIGNSLVLPSIGNQR